MIIRPDILRGRAGRVSKVMYSANFPSNSTDGRPFSGGKFKKC